MHNIFLKRKKLKRREKIRRNIGHLVFYAFLACIIHILFTYLLPVFTLGKDMKADDRNWHRIARDAKRVKRRIF